MLIYFFMITYVLVMYFVCKHFKNGLQFYYKSTLLLLFLISSLRSEYMGADYQTYIGIFEGIQIYGMKYPYEKGYVLLNMLIGMISEHYITLGVATSAVFFVCFYKYCYKYVELKNIHLVLYVFVMNPYLYIQSSFNILRQSCATAILMLGVHLLIEKKYWKYLIIVLLAAQFHSAAYVFILLIFFRMIDWKKDYFIIICSVSFVFNILLKNDQFLRRVANIFGFSSYIGYGNTEFDFPLFAVFVFAVNIFLLMNYNILFDNEREKFFLDLYMLALSSLPFSSQLLV